MTSPLIPALQQAPPMIAPALTGFIPPAPAVHQEPVATAAPVEASMADVVEKYRQVRDKKKEIADRHKEELEPYNAALGKIEALILDYLNRGNVDSIRTKNGTAYKTMRRSFRIDDPAALREFIEANNLSDLLENRISSSALEDYLSRGGNLPPGIGVSSAITVNIRK